MWYACCYFNLVILLLLNLMPLYGRIILTYIVVKDIFTGLLSTMKRHELLHNFQEYYNYIVCKYRLLSKIYQFNKWVVDSILPSISSFVQSPFDSGSILPISFCERLHIYLSFHNSELLHVVSWNQSQFSVFRKPPLLCEAKSLIDLELRLDRWPELPRHLTLSLHGWGYKYNLPWQGFYMGLSIELRFSCLLGKYITRTAVCTVPSHSLFNVHQPGNISFRLPFIQVFLLTSKKLYSLSQFHKTQILFLFCFSSLLTMQKSVVSNPAPLDTQPLEGNVFVQFYL